MSKQVIKNLMLFLFINFLVSIVIIFNEYYTGKVNDTKTEVAKTEDSTAPKVETNTNLNSQNVASTETPPVITNTEQTTSNSLNAVALATQPTSIVNQSNPIDVNNQNQTNNSNDSVCIAMGPFNLEEKGTMDFILNKSKELELAQVEKKAPYKIYWDLGKNQDIAEKLFKTQKDGAMADPKFELTQNANGNWVVDITTIKGSKAVVEKLTKDLANKASNLNAGGEWKFEQMKESYYYTFKQYNMLSQSTTKNIDVLLKPKKEPC